MSNWVKAGDTKKGKTHFLIAKGSQCYGEIEMQKYNCRIAGRMMKDIEITHFKE